MAEPTKTRMLIVFSGWLVVTLLMFTSLSQSRISKAQSQISTFNAGGCTISLYLPVVFKNYINYFEGPWEVEDNDTYLQSNGPILSGVDYYGYFDDDKDYFSVYMPTNGHLNIDLLNHQDSGIQLQLFYQSDNNQVGFDHEEDFHIDYSGLAGWYFIYVSVTPDFTSPDPYTLQVTYSAQNSRLMRGARPDADAVTNLTNWIGYNFETNIENWITSEWWYKLAILETTTEQVYSGTQSLKLTTELCVRENEGLRHTEATAYFDTAIPNGMEGNPGPYDLSNKQISCFVYLPSGLVSEGNPQASIRIFVKDSMFRNQFGDPIDIRSSIVDQWIPLFLAIDDEGSIDPGFDPTNVNTLGIRIDLKDDATISFTGSIYIDLCTVPDPVLYDDFNDHSFDGSWNTNLWEPWSEFAGQANQKNGVLEFKQQDDPDKNTNLLAVKYKEYELSEPTFFEAELMLDTDTDFGNVQLHLEDYVTGDWYTECQIDFDSMSQAWVGCFEYFNGDLEYTSSSIQTQRGSWHTVRIEVEPATMKFDYFIDGDHVGSNISDVANFDTSSFDLSMGIWRSPDAGVGDVIGYVDDVRIGRIID